MLSFCYFAVDLNIVTNNSRFLLFIIYLLLFFSTVDVFVLLCFV